MPPVLPTPKLILQLPHLSDYLASLEITDEIASYLIYKRFLPFPFPLKLRRLASCELIQPLCLLIKNDQKEFKKLMVLASQSPMIRRRLAEALSIQNIAGWTPLHVSARHFSEGFKSLLHLVRTFPETREGLLNALSVQNDEKSTPVFIIAVNSSEGFKALLELALDLVKVEYPKIRDALAEGLSIQNIYGDTPVHAVAIKSLENFNRLLNLAISDEVIRVGFTEALLKQEKNCGGTVLHFLLTSYPDAFKLLIDLAPRIKFIKDTLLKGLLIKEAQGFTVLYTLALASLESFKALLNLARSDEEIRSQLEKGLLVQTNGGRTILHELAASSPEGLKSLIDLALNLAAGGYPEIRDCLAMILLIQDDIGWTPIHIISHVYSESYVKLLEWARLDVLIRRVWVKALSIQNEDGVTPLHSLSGYYLECLKGLDELGAYLAEQGDLEIRDALLAGMSIKNKKGLTPLDWMGKCSLENFKILSKLKAGPKPSFSKKSLLFFNECDERLMGLPSDMNGLWF